MLSVYILYMKNKKKKYFSRSACTFSACFAAKQECTRKAPTMQLYAVNIIYITWLNSLDRENPLTKQINDRK